MLTIRKLALIIAAIFLTVLYILHNAPRSHPSIIRNGKGTAQSRPQRNSDDEAPSKDEIERIIESANRPLRHADEFKSLKDHLAYLFPYEGPQGTKFPAYIWQTWKSTPAMGDFDERFRITEASWTERHPDYVHEVITPTDAPFLTES